MRIWARVGCCFVALGIHCVVMSAMVNGQTQDIWIGTGASSLSRGIYHSKLDLKTGKLSEATLVAEMKGPGFLAKHPTRPVLYAVGNLNQVDVVAAFAIEEGSKPGEPRLKSMNAVPIGDGGAAHVSLDQSGKTLLTAQYGGGSVAAFSVRPDGSLGERTQLAKQEGGSKVVPGRQDASHAHWTGFSPDNRFAFVPDLGLDQVVVYRVDVEGSRLTKHGAGICPPGSGPRHMKFHPNGKWVYVLNELSLTVTQFDYNAEAGALEARETVPTVPPAELEREKAKSASEIRVHPNGKFLYAANRGHDTITVFAIDANNGKLREVQRMQVRGSTPRNFNLTPDGKWLLAAGQLSNTLALFSVDSESGELTFQQTSIFVPTPICVLME